MSLNRDLINVLVECKNIESIYNLRTIFEIHKELNHLIYETAKTNPEIYLYLYEKIYNDEKGIIEIEIRNKNITPSRHTKHITETLELFSNELFEDRNKNKFNLIHSYESNINKGTTTIYLGQIAFKLFLDNWNQAIFNFIIQLKL